MRATALRRSLVSLYNGLEMGRKYISLGGWCGPALLLGKLGLRTEAYPLDFSRCTIDGVIHFIRNGFGEGFYPPGPRPYRPECVGIYVLFRGQHTAFAHFDLNSAEVQQHFETKFSRFNALIDAPAKPVTFFRTVTARHPQEELQYAAALEEAIAQRNPALDFRLVFMVHDQGLRARAVELAPLSLRASLWALSYSKDAQHSLFDRCEAAYLDVVMHSVDEESWPAVPGAPPRPVGMREAEYDPDGQLLRADAALRAADVPVRALTADQFPWRSHDNLALIDGVASVGGTCAGVGSTRMVALPSGPPACGYCGSRSYHLAGRPVTTGRPFTDDEDQLLLVHLYKILSGGDKVEAVEHLAHEMKRGAYEVICRIQFLTNSSTKITDDITPHLSPGDGSPM
ncbi:hypothetical protein STCU_06869 [Strigomonas culicis]|uniref:Uncharacterized protein n=1 Tax=Strigomonas culicis TaxID=28005 RepID=S9TX19_9TRYP|nr:hypothetical protein STCU_08671 [Strigomonas culicis]EPY25048.1 hypothetical protein STCU_06869 [Strigomonas culicis]|eukprot:EPY21158.1 hypothetical protein STCU_08671 [Strigomonas culicis]